MIPEKLEECPTCGEDGDAWAYDFQNCRNCGYDGMLNEGGKTHGR